jgi:hypothetical protein
MIVLRIRRSWFGSVTSHAVTEFPATIGRNPGCDVWIDDPQVSSIHARLHRVGDGYVLENCSKTNGLRRGRRPVERLEFRDRCSFALGRLRVDAFSRTEDERTQEVFLPWHRRLRQVGITVSVFVSSIVLFAAMTPTDMGFVAALFVYGALVFPFFIATGAGLLALWSKIQTGRYAYFEALRLCTFLTPLFVLFEVASSTVAYNWPWRASRDAVVPILLTTLFGTFVALALRFVFREYRFRGILTAVLVVLFLFVGGAQVAYYADDTNSRYEFYAHLGYPIYDRIDGGLDELGSALAVAAGRLEKESMDEAKRAIRREGLRRDTASRIGIPPVEGGDENQARP